MIIVYSVLHLLVDGICALAMFGSFLDRKNGYLYILLYNCCAFALQMPFGVLLDMAKEHFSSRKIFCANLPFLTAAAGVLCTVMGAVIHPVLLGIGNALFHVGGGIGSIRQDNERNWRGRGLGIFVAPGALGLYLGTLLSGQGNWKVWYGTASAGMLVLCAGAAWFSKHHKGNKRFLGEYPAWDDEVSTNNNRGTCRLLLLWSCCFLVVILRSIIGMAVTFPWKTGVAAGTTAVLSLVLGKAAGGFLAARFGIQKTVVASMCIAALCYCFSADACVGVAAIFLFNMTMPITLYCMVYSMPRMPGLAFGSLTFALFLGFLPGYFGLLPQAGGNMLGCWGCILSLLLLLLGLGRRAG